MSLKVEGITVGYYHDVFVLHDVSLEAGAGEITCIIGPNGAGKSTILKTIYGFLKPKSGRVTLDGRDLTRLKPFEILGEGIAYLTQEGGLLPNMDVRENLELGAWLFRKDKERVKRTIKGIYDRYPLLRVRKNVKAGNLSGGEQRILEIGKALMNDPKVLLFDEPSAGLAPKIVEEIYDEIERLRGEERTIILVEQNVRKALTISNYAYVLELGRVKFGGTRDQMDLRQVVAPWLKA